MKALATRFIALGIALMLAVSPVLAQDAPGDSPTGESQPSQDQDQSAPSTDDTSSATPSPTPAPAATDVAAVIAQWGTAPSLGPDADNSVAQRWFREQNTKRARWGVPTATRDPYLDWMAENLLRNRLGQDSLPQPSGITKPSVAASSPQSDQAILSQTEFWTVSDDLWQAWLNSIEDHPSQFWQDAHLGEQWFTRDRYMRLELWRDEKFDRYRLMGVAGRVDTTGASPRPLVFTPGLPDDAEGESTLEKIAPGAFETYQPVAYPDNLVAVVAYNPWVNSDGSLRP
jgi:hypothetical protein